MEERMNANTINSTNEQFQSTSNDTIFKKSKKLEKRPLIGEKSSMSSAAANEHSALGRSPAITAAFAEDSSVHLTASDYSLDGMGEEGGAPHLAPQRTLNTTDGVFAPVALSQFSSLLFLRVGYLVGNGGLLLSLGLLLGCYIILFLTVLSICAISTNGAIEGGGAYFMISRTLGPEMGGAIGIVFYIANVFSCALYTSGCVEGIIQGITTAMNTDPVNATVGNDTSSFEMSNLDAYGLSLGINVLLFCVCIIGAKLFGKCTNLFVVTVTSIAFMVLIALLARSNIIIPYAHSVHTKELNLTKHAGNFTGPSLDTVRSNLWPHYNIDYTNGDKIHAMTLFGVLFSGVTGITSGANMSGQ
ncbi:Amino acid permease/ SLC12A domain [Trinorchestia longiramus]|nr:Amino acid permease/ SLC12A domain [Trinorchestia longiramus]